MGSLLVVLDHPLTHDLADLVEVTEQIQVQDFIAHRAVEAFDVGILVRLAGLDVADEDPVGLAPGHERLTQELRTVIDPTSPPD